MNPNMQTQTLMAIGSAQTKLTGLMADGDLDALAERIEGAVVPLSVLELTQLCAALCRRLADLERRVTVLDDPSRS